MDKRLALKALVRYLTGMVLIGLLVFLPAGTLSYARGQLFMGILFAPLLIMGLVLLFKSPELLRRRLNSKEKEDTQKNVVKLSGLMFVTGFVLAGLDFRFGWVRVPFGVSIGAAVVFLLGYGMYAEVMRENVYLSRTVEIQQDQKVIDTGLYGVVRHPMYTATILMFISAPLVLGSVIAFLIFLVYPAIIVMRIGSEEKVLTEGLRGYSEYRQKVKYRLIPFVW